MSELYHKQQSLLRLIERSLENFKKIGRNNYTPAKIRSRISSLKETWAQCIQLHASLLQITPEANREALDYFKLKHFDLAADVVQSTLDFMAECLEELEPSVSLHRSTSIPGPRPIDHAHSSFSLSHLPPINLPQFSGKFEEWESFRDRFTALIIHNPELSGFARMHFLSSSLAGRALETIKTIPVTADNFDIAWDTLKSRYDNKRRLVEMHISRLFSLPSVSCESAAGLNNLRESANRSIASLKHLNREPTDMLSDVLVFAVSQKLDVTTRRAWRLKGGSDSESPTYEELDRFIAARARALEDLSPYTSTKPARSPRFANAAATNVSRINCALCKESHFINKCSLFLRKSPSQRLDLIRQLNRCVNCLSSKHVVSACPSKYLCRTCHRQHHTMLHIDSLSSSRSSTATEPVISRSARDGSPPITSLSSVHLNSPRVLLATARVRVSAPSGRSCVVRALIDQGSEVTFITERLRQTLKLARVKKSITISAVGGVDAGACRYASRIFVSSLDGSGPVLTVTASILKTLTRYVPEQAGSLQTWEHLRGLALADSDLSTPDPIDLLLGADLYGELLLDGVKKGGAGQPVAQSTIFGWILSGPSSLRSHAKSRIHVQHCASSLTLEQELRNFWEIEEIPRRPYLSPDEQRCEDHFVTSHSRSPDGRYIVRLPFKRESPIDIGSSRHVAERVLRQLQRRFSIQPDLAQDYTQFLREYEDLGHMRLIAKGEFSDAQCVYIPHHPVLRESSSTTRLRVVFNASSASSNSTSLNDHLLPGPKLQTDLATVILKWRTYRYVLSADIAKMYRQILVDPRDVDYQRILWSANNTLPVQEYQLLTVTYGTASAPFLALRVLQQLVKDEGHKFPLAVPILREDIYVDDVLFGADDIPLLRQTRDQVRSLLRLGKFELRKWSSNSALLLHDIDPDDHGLACHKNLRLDENLKILGISWNPGTDAFQFNVSLPDQIPHTKREILSVVARIFDPLGWGTPATVSAKILLQKLWQSKLDWDDALTEPFTTQWADIYRSLSQLDGLTIPRWIGQGADTLVCEVHGFADASSSAYAAAVYLKVVSMSGHTTVSLLTGKSKVAPVKTWSIPQLELAAAVLLARLIEFSRDSLHLMDATCFCWTDSTIVLAWLSQPPARWKTFVANRVSDVQSRLPTARWRHVSTRDNPADCASRGCLGNDLVHHPLWWRGPTWLRLDPSMWPPPVTMISTGLEENPRAITHVKTTAASWDLATRYSSWPKLIRITAYLLRFITNFFVILQTTTLISLLSLNLSLLPSVRLLGCSGYAAFSLNYFRSSDKR